MAKQLILIRASVLKAAFFFGLVMFVLTIAPAEETKAKSPDYDPWYYVNDQTYKFMVPDKFQHFYGSALLTEIIGPMPALALGVSKEVYDDSDALVGFSMKDIAADLLGVISAKFARSEKVSLWLDWDSGEETLVLHFGIRL